MEVAPEGVGGVTIEDISGNARINKIKGIDCIDKKKMNQSSASYNSIKSNFIRHLEKMKQQITQLQK